MKKPKRMFAECGHLTTRPENGVRPHRCEECSRPGLFDPRPQSFIGPEDTRRASYVAMKKDAPTKEAVIESYIESAGARGRTCKEIEQALGMLHETVSGRIRSLVKKGRLAASGMTRMNYDTKKQAEVWVIPCHAAPRDAP